MVLEGVSSIIRLFILALPSFLLLYISYTKKESIHKRIYSVGSLLVFFGLYLDYITTQIAYTTTDGEELNPIMDIALQNSVFYESQLAVSILVSFGIVAIVETDYKYDSSSLATSNISSPFGEYDLYKFCYNWLLLFTGLTFLVILSNTRVILIG